MRIFVFHEDDINLLGEFESPCVPHKGEVIYIAKHINKSTIQNECYKVTHVIYNYNADNNSLKSIYLYASTDECKISVTTPSS